MDKDRIKKLEKENICLCEIIKNVNEGIILTDSNGVITIYNPAKEKMEKMTSQNMIGKETWKAYSYFNKEVSEHQKVLETGEPIIDVYRPHAYVNDIPVYIYYSTYPVIHNGKTIGVYTISRNESMLRNLLFRTIEHKRLLKSKNVIDSEIITMAKGTHFTFSDMVGVSSSIKGIIKEAQTVAPLNTPILISGETGTGKEVLAQSIHNFSGEPKNFVAINCAAIPENLVESVLFGTVKGAYTGAVNSIGLFRQAGSGTLFLDEINSMSTSMQAKLLRALQENYVRPVGGNEEYPIKCRLICASNEEPEALIAEKRMRQDLFYRISGFCIPIPPLRERREDIVEMANLYIKKYNHELHKHITRLSPQLKKWLYYGEWYGNCRELQNVIGNMMINVEDTDDTLEVDHIPTYALNIAKSQVRKNKESDEKEMDIFVKGDINKALDDYQRKIIKASLKKNHYNLTKSAVQIGIGRQNLVARMKRLGIDKKH